MALQLGKRISSLAPVQSATLRVFEAAPGEMLDSREVARRVLGKDEPSEAEIAAIRRALRLLARRGALLDLNRHWRDARRRWALFQVAHS